MAWSSSKKKEEIVTIELDEEEEGDQIELEELFFKRVGGPIPLKPQSSNYDLQNPPTQALAVSQNPEVLFLAHSQGFYVALTTDILDKAKETEKGSNCSIEELSVADVQIGRVCILAVSTDSSTLPACVFLHYIAFEQVDWSLGGNSIAVAKKNNISIFSSTFKERLMITPSFNGWVGDSDSGCTTKGTTEKKRNERRRRMKKLENQSREELLLFFFISEFRQIPDKILLL